MTSLCSLLYCNIVPDNILLHANPLKVLHGNYPPPSIVPPPSSINPLTCSKLVSHCSGIHVINCPIYFVTACSQSHELLWYTCNKLPNILCYSVQSKL